MPFPAAPGATLSKETLTAPAEPRSVTLRAKIPTPGSIVNVSPSLKSVGFTPVPALIVSVFSRNTGCGTIERTSPPRSIRNV